LSRLSAKYLKKYCDNDMVHLRTDDNIAFVTTVAPSPEVILQKSLEWQVRTPLNRDKLSTINWSVDKSNNTSAIALNDSLEYNIEKVFRQTTKIPRKQHHHFSRA
jgi:hypothetical protein